MAREPWPKKLEMAIALEKKYAAPPRVPQGGVLGMLVPEWTGRPRMNVAASDVSQSATRAAHQSARQRVAVTVLAIERFRRARADALPDDLGALVPQYFDAVPMDPYSGAALKFTRSEQGYKVYSVGTNRTDDGGDWTTILGTQTRAPTTSFVAKDIGIDIRKF